MMAGQQQYHNTEASEAHLQRFSNRKASEDCTKESPLMFGVAEVLGDSILCCEWKWFLFI